MANSILKEDDMNINKSLHSRAGSLLATTALACSIHFSAILFANAGTPLPANVKSTCAFSQTDFNALFESGSVAPNGIVLPADSFSFTPDPSNINCSFYKWSEQMFLWLTSPVPSRYGSGSHVFDSPVFYSLSPIDSNGHRTLIPHDQPLRFLPLISQRGPRGQDVVFDSEGKVHNVVHAAVGPNRNLLVRDKAGQPVEVGRVQVAPDGKPLLLDRTNKQIDVQNQLNGAPLLRNDLGEPLNLRAGTVLVNGIPHLVTTSGAVVQTEEAQAGGGALMATQNNSLVFYLLQVNDVEAYFISGMKDNKITNPTPTTFPTTGTVLGQITTFAQQAPPPFTKPSFPDNVAMAVEVKSSWIETTGLANPGDYITIDATVPTYNPPLSQPNNTKSVQSGTKQVKLALVGMHVVGSTLGHPEMLWATFEHVNNTPNPQYTFTTTSGTVGTQPADGPGGWVFSSKGAAGGTNNQRLAPNGTEIDAVSGQTIGPSDLVRVDPWGTSASDPNFTKNNTDIISINKNVIGLLAAGDARKNYILTGTTWIAGGLPPSTGTPVGTPSMANSTMETFFQPSNCFACHTDDGQPGDGSMLGTPPGPDGFSGGLSHVYAPIQPLFP
jgi:hypothetical protein